ncbi:MAG: hypothetical protein ACLP0J_28140 [Solirubrobacteraceae bacterium]
MRKIPTVFVRDPADRAHVLNEVAPGCEWVLAGEGVATRKYDGTCVGFDGTRWWARREVKPGKVAPPHFKVTEHDEETGKTVGWEPIEQSPFAKFHAEAVRGITLYDALTERYVTPLAGTYELLGPKINGNPERCEEHVLARHAQAQLFSDAPRDFERLRSWLLQRDYEGIVWHHPLGRMAKLKRRDFPSDG